MTILPGVAGGKTLEMFVGDEIKEFGDLENDGIIPGVAGVPGEPVETSPSPPKKIIP